MFMKILDNFIFISKIFRLSKILEIHYFNKKTFKVIPILLV